MTVLMEGCLGQTREIAGLTPRAPRLSLKVPVVFRFAEGITKGRSVDISESGLLATFDRRLDIWIIGQLSILVGESNVVVEARVARVNWHDAALAFRSMSGNDRKTIQNLIKRSNEEVS
jgi:hypothetical protein